MSHTTIYNKSIATQVKTIIEIVVEVHNQLDARWSGKSLDEIGFYRKDKEKRLEIFFGIWFEAWEYFGSPLCLAVEFSGYAPIEKYGKLEKLIKAKELSGVRFTSDFLGYAVLIFDEDFFNWENDAQRLARLCNEISISVDW